MRCTLLSSRHVPKNMFFEACLRMQTPVQPPSKPQNGQRHRHTQDAKIGLVAIQRHLTTSTCSCGRHERMSTAPSNRPIHSFRTLDNVQRLLSTAEVPTIIGAPHVTRAPSRLGPRPKTNGHTTCISGIEGQVLKQNCTWAPIEAPAPNLKSHPLPFSLDCWWQTRAPSGKHEASARTAPSPIRCKSTHLPTTDRGLLLTHTMRPGSRNAEQQQPAAPTKHASQPARQLAGQPASRPILPKDAKFIRWCRALGPLPPS